MSKIKISGRDMMIARGYTLLKTDEQPWISEWRKVDEDGAFFQLRIRIEDGAFCSMCDHKPCWTSPATAAAVIQHAKEMGWLHE